MKVRLALLAGVAALLSACDDAPGGSNDPAPENMVVAEETQDEPAQTAPPADTGYVQEEAAAPQPQEANEPQVLEVDAAPESFIDNAQGFSTEPIDDTSGFDPVPVTPEDFAAEPETEE